MATADTPIKDRNEDLLGVAEYARELAESIRRAEPPYTIGIYGEWGSGKTSLVNIARKHLDSQPGKPFTFIEFTAWPYKTAEDLWRALILKIAQELYEVREVRLPRQDPSPPAARGVLARLRNWLESEALVLHEEPPQIDATRGEYESLVARLNGTSYGGVGSRTDRLELKQEASLVAVAKAVTSALGTVSPLVAAIRNLFGLDEKIKVGDLVQRESNEATRSRLNSMAEFSAALQDLFDSHARNKGTCVCVFIDDLDRCMPDVALDLLEAIKVLLGGVQCVFIVAADQQLIAQSLRARFGSARCATNGDRHDELYTRKGQEYFEKIVQFGVQVPEPTPEVAHRFIAAQFPQWVPVSDLLETAIGTNPRRLKQQCCILDYKIAIAREQQSTKEKEQRRSAELDQEQSAGPDRQPSAGRDPLQSARRLGQRLPLREKLVSAYYYSEKSLEHIAALTEHPDRYEPVMVVLEMLLPRDAKDQPGLHTSILPAGVAQDLYACVVGSGPLLSLLRSPPHLSEAKPSSVSALARFADVRPAPGGGFMSRDPIFLRVLERVSLGVSVSAEELLREDLARMILANNRQRDFVSHLIELAGSPQWPAVLTELERRIEEPGRKTRTPLPDPAKAILDLVEKSPPTNDHKDPRPLVLARPRFSAICREEVSGFAAVRDRLPVAVGSLSNKVHEKITDEEEARWLAGRAFELLAADVKDLVELAFTIRADAAKDYLDLRRFAKVQLLAHRWPQLLAYLTYRRAAVLDLEQRVLQSAVAREASRGPLDHFLEDERLVRFLSLRPYLKDIYAEDVAEGQQVSAAAPSPSQPSEAVPTAASGLAATPLEYENIILELSETRGMPKAVVQRGTRKKGTKFELPEAELAEIFHLLRTAALGPAAMGREPQTRTADATITIRDVGVRLLDRVAQGAARELLLSGLQDRATRTRLVVRASKGRLSLLPWESLYVKELRAFLGLSESYSLVRHIVPGHGAWPQRIDPPLRVLAVLSNPEDVAPLNLQGEAEMLRVGLGPAERAGWAQLTVMEDAVTVDRVLQQLVLLRPHVFHFAGHGLYSEQYKEGALVLGGRVAEPVIATQIANMLESNGVVLATLNGCDTGSSLKNDAITGVAGTLVRRGLPAVVATMREIVDEAALTFTRSFYHALVQEDTLEAALIVARKALSVEKWDWSTYALFTSLEDPGRLRFSPPQAQRSSDVLRIGGGTASPAA